MENFENTFNVSSANEEAELEWKQEMYNKYQAIAMNEQKEYEQTKFLTQPIDTCLHQGNITREESIRRSYDMVEILISKYKFEVDNYINKREKLLESFLEPIWRKEACCYICKKHFDLGNYHNFRIHVISGICAKQKFEHCPICSHGIQDKRFILHLKEHREELYSNLVQKIETSKFNFEENKFKSCGICKKPMKKTNVWTHEHQVHQPKEGVRRMLAQLKLEEEILADKYPMTYHKPKKGSLEYLMDLKERILSLAKRNIGYSTAKVRLININKRINKYLSTDLLPPLKKKEKKFVCPKLMHELEFAEYEKEAEMCWAIQMSAVPTITDMGDDTNNTNI